MRRKIISPDPQPVSVTMDDSDLILVFRELWSKIMAGLAPALSPDSTPELVVSAKPGWFDPRLITVSNGLVLYDGQVVSEPEALPTPIPTLTVPDPLIESIRLFGVMLYHLKMDMSELTNQGSYRLDRYYQLPDGIFADLIELLTSIESQDDDLQFIMAEVEASIELVPELATGPEVAPEATSESPIHETPPLPTEKTTPQEQQLAPPVPTPDPVSHKIQITTRAGNTFEVNTSDAALKPFGLYHYGDRVLFTQNDGSTSMGNVMGVNKQDKDRLWFIWDKDVGKAKFVNKSDMSHVRLIQPAPPPPTSIPVGSTPEEIAAILAACKAAGKEIVHVTSREGVMHAINISDAVCQPFGFHSGDRFRRDGHYGTVIGVANGEATESNKLVLWTMIDRNYGLATYFKVPMMYEIERI